MGSEGASDGQPPPSRVRVLPPRATLARPSHTGIPAASHLRGILLERVISIIESAALEQHRAVCVDLI